MKSYVVRVYEDHYLVREEDSPVGTFPVEIGKLEGAIALGAVAPEKAPPKPKKARKPRGPNKPKAAPTGEPPA